MRGGGGGERPCASRLRETFRKILAFLFSNVGVVILVLGYTIAGAFTFYAIEGASEIERAQNMTLERNATANYLWENVTLVLNPFNKTELACRLDMELEKYQRKVVKAVRRGWDGGRTSRKWSFSSAFLYSLTVITTIGYGNLSPRTGLGKVTTIFYALLGMPLFLLYLSNVGELLARWFKCIYALICLCRGCPGFTRRRVAKLRTELAMELEEISEVESIERPVQDWRAPPTSSQSALDQYCQSYQHQQRRPAALRSVSMPDQSTWSPEGRPDARIPRHLQDQRRGYSEPVGMPGESEASSDFTYVTFDAQTITVPISVCVTILVSYILFGSMLFGMWEKWDQLDGAYFCFISLSSIGFGDFVPGERVYTPKIETSFIACSLYLMLGMALVAMCFNLMQEQVIHYFAGIKRALKRICRCKR